MNCDMLPAVIDRAGNWERMPRLVDQAGGNARFAWDELFSAELRNRHTRRAYLHAVRQFLAWCESRRLELGQITPGWVGTYYDELHASIPTKKQHLSALRCFFDRLVLRHAVGLNPAASVRGERYQLVEGKDAGDHGGSGARASEVHPPVRRRGPPRPGDRRHPDLHRRAHRGGGRTQRRQFHSRRQSEWFLRFVEKGGRCRDIPKARGSRRLPYGLCGGRGATVSPARWAAVPQAHPHDEGGQKHGDDSRRHGPNDQAAHERHWPARTTFATFFQGRNDHRPADARRSAPGSAASGRSCRPKDNPAVRPQAKAGHANHRRQDFGVAEETAPSA